MAEFRKRREAHQTSEAADPCLAAAARPDVTERAERPMELRAARNLAAVPVEQSALQLVVRRWLGEERDLEELAARVLWRLAAPAEKQAAEDCSVAESGTPALAVQIALATLRRAHAGQLAEEAPTFE